MHCATPAGISDIVLGTSHLVLQIRHLPRLPVTLLTAWRSTTGAVSNSVRGRIDACEAAGGARLAGMAARLAARLLRGVRGCCVACRAAGRQGEQANTYGLTRPQSRACRRRVLNLLLVFHWDIWFIVIEFFADFADNI